DSRCASWLIRSVVVPRRDASGILRLLLFRCFAIPCPGSLRRLLLPLLVRWRSLSVSGGDGTARIGGSRCGLGVFTTLSRSPLAALCCSLRSARTSNSPTHHNLSGR